ncbi:TPR-like protein [Athelia psychrophila]|uniref:TPR-like protein n=1 Tax=Athelia psychrophila TaxID=1759441 RepID=A0A166J351_9AGAM|nr:TPR-like protein [Fibularhizoctonia sp. CBS 109695]
MPQWLKSKPQWLSRSPSPASIPQSSVLETTRNVCTLVSNLGSGALNVPGLQAAGLIGCQIIDIVQKMKDNQDACKDLVDHIGKLMSPIYSTLQGCNITDIDVGLREDIQRLQESMQAVQNILQHQADRRGLVRALNSARDAGKIAECKDIINRQLVAFGTYSLISVRMGMIRLQHTIEERKTALDYSAHQVLQSVPSQPVPSEHFFGRKDIVSTLANLFIGDERCRIAILGAGGLGKTSIALHLIHHDIVVTRFSDRQFFVGCDGVTTADGLAARILQILGVPGSASGNIIDVLHASLKEALPTLLLLDNLESTWDAPGDHSAVQDLLQKIASVKSVSLIITMRATDPPSDIQWSWSEPIPVLSPASAKEVFLAIHGQLPRGTNDYDEVLEVLLKELDYVPLAIHLLAQVSRGFQPTFMLKRWRERRTQMLRLPTPEPTLHRLQSVDVSISFSITSLDAAQNPGSIQLLGMLCLLPDGLLCWQERLEVIEKTFENAISDLLLLRKFALVYTAGDKLSVLSPIRHFVLHHYPPDIQHSQCIRDVIWEVVDTYATVEFGPELQGAIEAISPEMGNIGNLIDHAVIYDPGAIIVDIAIQISKHLCRTHPSLHILKKVSKLVPAMDTEMQAQYWLITGDIMHAKDEYGEATRTCMQARDLFLEIGDRAGAAQCSESLGDSLRMQSEYSEAAAVLKDAQAQFFELGDRSGAARCSQSLGQILHMQMKYSEATAVFINARAEALEIGDRLGAAQCSQSLGNSLSMQSEYSEAAAILTVTRAQYLDIGERLGAAQCSQSMGEILSVQSNYSEATEILTNARTEFLEIGERLGAAQCSKILGDNLRIQGEYSAAAAILTAARSQFLQINNRLGEAQCARSLGQILHAQRKYTEAENLLMHARDQFLDIGLEAQAAECSELLEECTDDSDDEESTETSS